MGVIIPQPSLEDRAAGGQRIDGSLKFDRTKTPKLKRTFTTAGNRKTWTWSGWVRKDELDDGSDWLALFLTYPAGTTYAGVKGYHNLADDIGFSDIDGGSISSMVSSNRLLRDLGWYHIVCILDTTQATNTDRVKLWVNGERITSIYSGRVSYLAENADGQVNDTDAHYIGAELYNGGDYASDCTMSQCYFIDGQALEASYFGYTDPLTNTWRPKKYTGSYTKVSYNTAITWSGSSSNITNPANAFNGYTASGTGDCYANAGANSDGYWDLPSNIVATKVECYIDPAHTSVTGAKFYARDTGSTQYTYTTSSVSGDSGWVEIPLGGATRTINRLGCIRNSGGSGSALFAWRITNTDSSGTIVTNEILIDGFDGRGVNSFYLPFDGSAPIGQDQSGNGNDFTPHHFSGGVALDNPIVSGAVPILNTINGGKVAVPGVRGQAGIAVTVYNSGSGNKYYLDGAEAGTVKFVPGQTVTFDTSDTTVGGHPFRLSGTSDGSHNAFYSVDFDGTGDYLSIPDNADFYYGSGDFTLECWVNPNVAGTHQKLITAQTTGGANHGPCNLYFTNGVLQLWSSSNNSSPDIAGGVDIGTPPAGEWSHIAVSREGTSIRLFFNGLNTNTVTSSAAVMDATGDFNIGGRNNGSDLFNGKISDFRIVKGTAVYTSNFIPPSVPLTNITNTKLLCCNASTTTGSTVTPDTITAAGDPTASGTNPYDTYVYGTVTGASEGSVGAATTITFPLHTPSNLYYYCTNHSGMGGSVSIGATNHTIADPYAQFCKLALPLIGNNTDVSNIVNTGQTAHTFTDSGAVADFAHSNFYGGSYIFDGTNDKITAPNSSDWNFGSGDWTIEFWTYTTSGSSFAYVNLSVTNATSNSGWIVYSNSGQPSIYTTVSTGWTKNVDDTPSIVGKGWRHVAIVRKDSTLKVYLDGTSEGTPVTNMTSIPDSTLELEIGKQSSSYWLNGNMSDLRIYKGIAKYSDNFVIPSTFPDIIQDNPSGVAYSSELTKPTTGAVAFDGNGDYLSLASTSDFAFGTGDFTLECWAYHSDVSVSSNYPYLFEMRDPGGGGNRISLYVTNNNTIQLWVDGIIFNDGYFGTKRWNHVAISRVSGNLRLFNNGQIVGTHTTEIDFTGAPLLIGQRDGYAAQSWPGFISNVRIVKGTGLYTSDFTPPTAPLTNVTNTKLLCCQSNNGGPQKTAVIPSATGTATAMWPLNSDINDDSGNNNTLTENGGSTSFTSAGTNSFGLSNCADFASDGKYLSYAVSPASQWTIDFYVKFDDVSSGSNSYIGGWDAFPGSNCTVGITKSNSTWTVWGDTNLYTSTVAAVDTWYHVRLTSNSSTNLRLYINGILIGTDNSNDQDPGTPLNFGDMQSGRFDGQIAGVRYTPTDLGAPSLGGDITSSGVTSNSPSVGVSLSGDVARTFFNPFNTDINTVMGQETGYCTWNLLDKSSNQILFDGLLTVGSASNAWEHTKGTIGFNSGKYYWEIIPISSTQINAIYGISDAEENVSTYPGGSSGHSYVYGGARYDEGTYSGVVASSWVEGDVLGVAVDCDGGIIKYYINNIFQSSANISTTKTWFPSISVYYSDSSIPKYSTNFGQKPFKFPPPEGFLPLNFANIPRPTLVRPDQYVKPVVYTGNDSGNNSGTGNTWGIPVDVGFGPDLVWLKSRTQTYGWYIYDTVRGGNKDGGTAVPGVDKECYDYMLMQATDAQVNAGTNGDSTLNGLGMNQKGFNVDIGGQAIGEAAQGTHNMAAWCWKAGGWKGTWNLNGEDAGSASAAGLTTGDTSVLNAASINTEAGFSIVKWTQDSGGSSKNIAHGLTQAPNFVIMKHINNTSNWFVAHTSLSSAAKVLYMNSDSDEDSSSDFGNTFPSATYTTTSTTGVNGREVIMYSWHNIPGLQKFGSYTANNSSDGPFVNLGFKPAIVMVKVFQGGTNNWVIWDRARMEGTGNNSSTQTKGNPNLNTLQPDDTTEEPNSGFYYVDFLNNGFKLRVGGAGALRVNGNSTSYKYVYCAWAETPHNPLYGGQPNAL